MPAPYVKTYTLEIGGVERAYKNIDFEDKLEKVTAGTFSAIIKYYDDINYFDLVEIKCNGITEWKGFLEDIDIQWGASGGRIIKVGGRDNSIIIWKKWCENFSNMHEETLGFFGRVNASELIKFLLRCPKSDLDPIDNKYNKEGWGIDSKWLNCSSIVASPNTRSNSGDPNQCLIRKQNTSGWRSSGGPYNSKVSHVDVCISNSGWATTGATPYIDSDDGTKQIYGRETGDTAIFSFEDLSVLDGDATAISHAMLSIKWKADALYGSFTKSERARVSCYLSIDEGVTWGYYINFDGMEDAWTTVGWRIHTWDITSFVNTVAKADALRIKLIVDPNVQLGANITQAYVTYDYVKLGNQQLGDEFDITFATQDVMGIYFESRQDDESYPRNYGLLSITDVFEDYANNFQETDPNLHISKTTYHIDFNAYQNENAYVFKDLTAGGIGQYFDYYFTVKVVDPVVSGGMFGIWAATDSIADVEGLHAAGLNNLVVFIKNDAGAGPKFYLREVENGVEAPLVSSLELTEGTTYLLRIIRRLEEVIVFIYNANGRIFDVINLTMTDEDRTYRYLFNALTANTGNIYHTVIDIDSLKYETYEDLGWVDNNTYRDIIHSWSPKSMNHIRIRITDTDSHGWAISQVYVYEAEETDYRIMHEGGTEPSFALNQYITTITLDDSYSIPIGPLNVGKQRVMDAVKQIVEMCHTSYVPFEYYIDTDSGNTFHIIEEKGTDKTATISFVKGTHLGGVIKTSTIADTVQRVQVVGKGEDKTQDDVSSNWIQSSETANVHTWYEDTVTEKTVIDKEVANMLANIHLMMNGGASESLEVIVNNDEDYDVNAYLVGDDVTVTDSLTGTSGSHRIYNIRKSISNNGVDIIINFDSSRKIPEDALKDLYNKIKQLSLQATIASDWGSTALNKKAIDAKAVLSSLFSSTAKNDEVTAPKSLSDPSWVYITTPTGSPTTPSIDIIPAQNHFGGMGYATGEQYSFDKGIMFTKSSDWMKITGPTTMEDAVREMGCRLQLVDENGVDNTQYYDTPLTKNPKFTAELKFYKRTGFQPYDWQDDDYFDVGMYNPRTNKGFLIRFIREDGVMKAYARWNTSGDVDGWSQQLLRIVKESEGYYDPIGVGNPLISWTDYRYKIEILTEKDADRVIMGIYDVSLSNPIIEKYPISAVAMNVDPDTINVEPLFMFLSGNRRNTKSSLATVYMYNYKFEIETVERDT